MWRGSLIAAALLAPWLANAVVQTNGPAVSVSVLTNAVGNRSYTFDLAPQGRVEVTPYAQDVVRVRFHFATLYDREEQAIAKPFGQWPAFACTETWQGGTNLLLETDQLQISIALSNRFRVVFRTTSNDELLGDTRIEFDEDYHQLDDTNAYAQIAWPEGSTSVSNRPTGFKLRAIKPMNASDAFFGLGDSAGPQNRRGSILQGWAQDTFAFGEFRTPRYATLPMLHGLRMSSGGVARAWGLFFNNPARPVFDLSGTTNFSFEAGDDQLDWFFFGGGSNHTAMAVLDRYTELTGRPAFLPRWAYGYHQSRHSYDTQSRVQEIATALRTNAMPCDALYLDIDVQNSPGGARQQLTFNATFTNVPGMVTHCTNLGLRLVPVVEPCLLTNDPRYATARTNLYFLKRNDLGTYVGTNFLGRISWLDFSITNTASWWRDELGGFLTNGFSGLWNDLNEPNENALPLDAIWYLDGRYGGGLVTNDTRKWHAVNKNTYCLLESRVSHAALLAAVPAQRPFLLSRGAWPGIAPLAAGWSGDNVSSFDHLRFSIRLGLGVMISGQPNFGHDVGGFVGDAQPELLTRWLEADALTPFFRNHTLNGTADQEPWAFGDPWTLWNRRAIELRYRMMPYLYSLFHACSTDGVPANLPAAFVFPADTNTWSRNETDYFVGSHLLVAPVVASGATTRTVYLPVGSDWFAWTDDERLDGGQTITRAASLGTLPMYARAGAIVPMGALHAYAGAPRPAWLEVHVWPGRNAFTLFEDDGETTNHEAGAYAATTWTVSGSASNLTMAISPRTGTYPIGLRSWKIVAHALSNVVAVSMDGLPLPRAGNRDLLTTNVWCFDTVTRCLFVQIDDDAAAHTLHVQTDATSPVHPVFTSAFTNVTVAGTFNAWNEASRNLRLVSNGVWAGTLDLRGQTNVEFKFVANDQWTATNWGDNAQSSSNAPFADTADGSGFNIQLPGAQNSRYTFVFNETTRAYAVMQPENNDADGDGMPDAWEVNYGLNPAGAGDTTLDLDGDGLSNVNEFLAGGIPTQRDTDGDRVDDAAEFAAGTSLTNPASFLAAQAILPASGGVSVFWTAITGRLYALYAATNLPMPSDWQVVPPFTNLGGAGTVSVTDTNATASKNYRIRVQP